MPKVLKRTVFLLIVSCLPCLAQAQFGKGQRLYENYAFQEAIPYLRKSLDGKNANQAAVSLADSYRRLRNYPEAETYYRKVIALGNPSPESYLRLGEALLNNGKYDEAEEQFAIFASLAPNDPRAKYKLESIAVIRGFDELAPGFSVSPVGNLNTNAMEMSPAVYGKGIAFASDQPSYYNYVKRPHPSNSRGRTMNLFYADFASSDSLSTGEWKKMPRAFAGGNYNGPVSFTETGRTAVFNQVNVRTSSAPGIVITQLDKGSWSKPDRIFPEAGFPMLHPAISPDGKTLYFAAEMPEGKGGLDIYRSVLKGSQWGPPENLGDSINTPFNEVFPYLSTDGTFYFASDGHAGLGGLDIFMSQPRGKNWSKAENLRAPLNSSADDFGITYANDGLTGFFTSNREGTLRGDDIYRFVQLDKRINILGTLTSGEQMNEPLPNLGLVLIDQLGRTVQTGTTDASGNFRFENVPMNQTYTLTLTDSITALETYNKVYLADREGVYKKSTTDNKGVFTFYNVPKRSAEEGIEDDTRITVSGSLLAGESPARPLVEQTVYLTNPEGVIVATGQTDQYGNFKFEHLPPDNNFMVSLNPEDTQLEPNTRIVVTDSKGKTVRTFFTDAQGAFKFEVLSSEATSLRMLEEENTSLRIDLKGKLFLDEKSKAPLPNSVVKLVDERGQVMQTARTDAQGNFQFTNLPSDNNYMVTIAETDVPVNVEQLYIADDRGKVIRKLLFDRGGFKFEILPADQKMMASIYVEDPWLKIRDIKESKKDSITVIENVYYDYGKFDILPAAAVILDRVVSIMNDNPDVFIELSSHTDSRSSAEFNLDLSRKRAKSAVEYIISKGIPSSRIAGLGMGEQNLVNYCSDGVECSEEQHQQNRRTEFKVVRVR